ncbi:colanic acid biosynthesis glycosyltransferase WcaL [Erwinia endophytica]|uniref:glycosyltransferase family 4 protein n=1 Tax=Erwinia endophytica TaxID=1563158 RepID=UPI001265F9D1|nr:glycosyltransferase family 4 protein [Erwinia endophytica]KAB8311913.1 colanic acid biosynthesis glycosyltransferase WcaL [Erwinia endophytica]
MAVETLHVGYVLKRYPRFSETFVVNEILAHERAGMRVDIFALGPVMESHFQPDIGKVQAPVIRLSDKQRNVESFWGLVSEALDVLPGFAERLAEEKAHSVHELAQGIKMALLIRQRNIQHLHAHFATQAATVARLAAKFSGVSWSLTAHAKDIYFHYEQDIQLPRKLQDASHVVTVSDYNLRWLCEQYAANKQKTSRIYNGLDLRQFPWCSPYQRPPEIVAAGRLVAKKGFLLLIDSLARLQAMGLSFHCTLIGDGPLREQLDAGIQNAGLEERVTLTGPLPRDRVAEAIQQAAMVVAPCTISEDGDRDGLPTILVEAMALGTPVISTRVVGIPELVVDQETGLCVEPDNPGELALAMARLLQEADTREKLSRQAREMIAREYDVDRNTAKLRTIFHLGQG